MPTPGEEAIMEGHGLWQSSLLEIMEDFLKEEALGGGLSQCPEASLKNKHARKKILMTVIAADIYRVLAICRNHCAKPTEIN